MKKWPEALQRLCAESRSSQRDMTNKLTRALDYLGASTDLETFSNRKKLQKLTYLVQIVYGVKLGFGFSWYLHGPYSPQLTRALYNGNLDSQNLTQDPTEQERKRLEDLKHFLGNDIKSSDTLELIASLHYVMTMGKETGKSDEEIILLALTHLTQQNISSKTAEVIQARTSHEKKWRRYKK